MQKTTLALAIALPLLGVPASAGDEQAAQPAPRFEQVSTQIKAMLTKEKLHTRFDLARKLQAQGLTWQPSLVAPNDLVGKLTPEQLGYYAGIKISDALYALTFMQRQSVADSVRTIEQIHERLNIRSYADIQGKLAATLRKAAAEPETANVQLLIKQVADNTEVDALMSNPKSAAYLLDTLYGMTIETGNLLASFYKSDPRGEGGVMRAVPQQKDGIGEWLQLVINAYEAAGRANETIQVKGKAVPKMALLREILRHRQEGDTKPDSLAKARASVYAQAAAIRDAMLTPVTR